MEKQQQNLVPGRAAARITRAPSQSSTCRFRLLPFLLLGKILWVPSTANASITLPLLTVGLPVEPGLHWRKVHSVGWNPRRALGNRSRRRTKKLFLLLLEKVVFVSADMEEWAVPVSKLPVQPTGKLLNTPSPAHRKTPINGGDQEEPVLKLSDEAP